MLLTLEGTYKDGKVELQETPREVSEVQVLVTFLPPVNKEEAPQSPEEKARQAARKRLLARMKKGYHLGGGPYYHHREELYDRVR